MISKVIGLIPARLAATRLPDKPLIDIVGKTMIQRVWERASLVRGLDQVAIATPDEAIARTAEAFGAKAIMTAAYHRSGTDRIAEAARHLGLGADDIVVNIQGDEPLLDPKSVEAALQLLLDDAALPMASLMCPCPDYDRDNIACVKVVAALNGDALYFSRSRIPNPRADPASPAMQHVGLYAYRMWFLETYSALEPTPLEKSESLEQLRVLENGYRIRMARVDNAPIGVDTEDDLERVRRILTVSPRDEVAKSR